MYSPGKRNQDYRGEGPRQKQLIYFAQGYYLYTERNYKMKQASNGSNVKVHYKGSFDDGTVFDSSQGCDPLEFSIGGGQVIPAFEDAVIGMNMGETKTIRITADKAYGAHNEEMVVVFTRDKLPADIQPEVGQAFRFQQCDGYSVEVKVIDVSESTVTFDANHPLAGKDLNFEIQLIEMT